MYCKNCGTEMKQDAAFCENCGMSAGQGSAYCSNCGTAVVPGAVICAKCGMSTGSQAAYNTPAEASALQQKNESSALAVTGMVLGILSLLLCCGALLPMGIAGIICSGIALGKKKPGKGMAIAGLVTSIISVVGGVIVLFYFSAVMVFFSDAVASGNWQALQDELNSIAGMQ